MIKTVHYLCWHLAVDWKTSTEDVRKRKKSMFDLPFLPPPFEWSIAIDEKLYGHDKLPKNGIYKLNGHCSAAGRCWAEFGETKGHGLIIY